MSAGQVVAVAMSGGVDSSVAAALLKEQGFEVLGMMLRLWSEPGKEDSNRCCTPDSMALARRVAVKLDIPFYAVDARQVFRDTVVDYFLEGYARGETPNPCLACNRQIRWTYLLNHAIALGADFLATGHYARTRQGKNGRIELARAVDPAKDQSYVLHVMDQNQLQRALFPVGGYLKTEIRQLAEARGLPTAARSDSQDLCFLAGGNYRDFVLRNRPEMLRPGPIVSLKGDVLGEHRGLANYTIGQRRNLGLRSTVPLYVLRKDARTNRLTVGAESDLGSSELTAGDVRWISGTALREPFRAQVKTRYTAKEAAATVAPLHDGRQVRIVFDSPQRDITPGQAAVFYDGDLLVGGGIIQGSVEA